MTEVNDCRAQGLPVRDVYPTKNRQHCWGVFAALDAASIASSANPSPCCYCYVRGGQ